MNTDLCLANGGLMLMHRNVASKGIDRCHTG